MLSYFIIDLNYNHETYLEIRGSISRLPSEIKKIISYEKCHCIEERNKRRFKLTELFFVVLDTNTMRFEWTTSPMSFFFI